MTRSLLACFLLPRSRAVARSRVGLLAILVAAAAALAGSHAVAPAQPVDPNLWVTDARVDCVVRDGGTIYIGGNFTRVGPATGGGAPINAVTGGLPPAFAKVDGTVYAVAADGAGGWYIGGSFTHVGGLPRSNLAHVVANLSVSAWNPNANSIVRALVVSGSTVYAGGDFSSVGGQARNRIAALDAATGAAMAWDPNANSIVRALVVSGSTVYVGGDFSSVGGQTRNSIAALDAGTGVATAWNPNAGDFTWVSALAVRGSTIYAGGGFTSIGGQPRNGIAALDAATGAATAWDPNAGGTFPYVLALAVSGSTVYAGGEFTSIGGQPRGRIAALDAATGAATAWNAAANGAVTALAVSGSTIYAGGLFRDMSGQTRNGIAALDAATGEVAAWAPSPNNYVTALAVSGSTVYAGGVFTSIGGQPRLAIAGLDAATGTVTAWNANAGGFSSVFVNALAVSGSTVYVGGSFTAMGGQSRNNIAAIDAATGAATAFNPNANSTVFDLAVSGSTVYAGGRFTSIGGQVRNNIAALDAATGAATAWNPNAGGGGGLPWVHALVVIGSTVFAGGEFTSIGGQTRNRIAALDAATGAATAWNPNANEKVFALAAGGAAVYVGGQFTGIGGQSRNRIAALDAATGAATSWNPNAGGPGVPSVVYALAVSGSTVYAGGGFTSIGGQARSCIAALDAATGAAVNWSADANTLANPSGATPFVRALAVSGPTIYAGGDFTGIGGRPQRSIAAIGDATTPVLLSLASTHATPDHIRLTWSAPAGDVMSATVHRRTAQEDWKVVGQIWSDGTGRLVYEDTQVTSGARYGYQLGVMESGREIFVGETWVDVPRVPELALALRDNPSRHALDVSFSLSDDSPARIELLDVSGRSIATRAVRSPESGRVVSLADARTLAPGVYVVCLTQGPRSITTRAVIIR